MMVRMPATMWESDRKRSRRPQWWAPLLLGLAISVAQITMVATAWRDCGVIDATGLDEVSLYALGVPALTFLNAILVVLPAEVYLSRRGNRAKQIVLMAVSVAVLVAAETLVLGHFVATPTAPEGTACVDNVPKWWPTWMPT